MIPLPVIDLGIVAPLSVLFGWATVLLLVDVFAINNKRVTGYLAVVGLLATAVIATLAGGAAGGEGGMSLVEFASADAPFNGMVVLDSFAVALTWIFALVGVISIFLALNYLPRQGIEQGEFYPLIMFATGGMIILAQGTDLIMLFLGLELLSITLYILTAFAYPRLASEEAAMKYLLLGAFAAGFFVYGIALIYGETGTVQLMDIGAYMQNYVGEPPVMLLIGMALVIIAFGFKVALVPFHMWTPDVYEGAPTPVTAFMSVGTKGAAFAALIRILHLAAPTLADYWLPILSVLAFLTMLIGNIGALVQMNIKRMLAYSSISHAGYILIGVMALTEQGTSSFLFYLLAYALANLGAFGVIIALEQKGEETWSLDDFNGLWKRNSNLAVAMTIFMLSLAGVPPTAGFVGKFAVFAAAWESGLGLLVLMGLVTSAIAVFFYLRVIVRMFMYEDLEREMQPPKSINLHRALSGSIAVAVVGTILFGLLPSPIVTLVQQSTMVAFRAVGG